MVTEAELINQDATVIANANIEWNRFEGKTVLISGATGYVSQYIVHGLLKRNDLFGTNIKVIAYCRNKSKADIRFKSYYDRDDFEVLVGNILDKVQIGQKIDFIIHTASPAGLVKSNIDPVETFKVNVIGCDNLLMLAEEKGAEFLLLSSVDIYGKVEGGKFVENLLGTLDTTDVRNVYAYAKRASENLCACYAKKGIVARIVRPTQIMGGGVELQDGRLHIDFISQILSNKKIVLKGDGSPIRSFIYITDAIIGMLTVIAQGENGNAYNIANEDAEVSVLDFAKLMVGCTKELVEIEFNETTRKTSEEVKHAVSVVTANAEKLKALGWDAKVSIKESCEKMLEYYGVEILG